MASSVPPGVASRLTIVKKVEEVVKELRSGALVRERENTRVLATRRNLLRRWTSVSEALRREGHAQLADRVLQYAGSLPLARTEKEIIAESFMRRAGPARSQKELMSQ